MKARNEYSIIIIDDDPISNLLTEVRIKSVYNQKLIRSFTNPLEGIAAIEKLVEAPEPAGIIVFLDINMPELSGWDVLDKLLPILKASAGNMTRIYMLSSSIDINDKIRAAKNMYVSGYFEKPLNTSDFSDLIFKTNYLNGATIAS
jgi:DNA-binding NarL/FixJ family response regulator